MDRFLKTLALLAVMAAPPVSASAQTLVESVPARSLYLLDAKRKQALVQRWQKGQHPAQIQNLGGGITVLDSLSEDYLRLHPSASDEIVMKRFPEFLLMIHTVFTPEPDSRLSFLDMAGNELKKEIKLSARDFYVPNDTLSETQYLNYALPFVPHWQLEGDTLSVRWNLRSCLPREDWAKVAQAHRSTPILYIWNDKFMKIK